MNFKTFIPVTDDCTQIDNPYLQYLNDDSHLTIVDEDVTAYSRLLTHIGRGTTYTQYWVWKNCELEYYGFGECERILCLKKDEISDVGEHIQMPGINENSLLNLGYHSSNVEKFLTNETNFIGYPIRIETNNKTNIYQLYKKNNTLDVKCLECTIQTLHDLYPEYSTDLNNYFNGTRCYSGNLYIMHNSLFKQYCDWLFQILNEVLNRLAYDGHADKLKYNVD